MKQTIAERVKHKMENDIPLRIAEATFYLQTHKTFITEVQLRNWVLDGRIPYNQAGTRGLYTIEADTVLKLVSGELPGERGEFGEAKKYNAYKSSIATV